MQEWFDYEAADVYHLLFPYYPTLSEDFVQLVIPVLQNCGIFREDYEGTTLREHLGLQVPDSWLNRKRCSRIASFSDELIK